MYECGHFNDAEVKWIVENRNSDDPKIREVLLIAAKHLIGCDHGCSHKYFKAMREAESTGKITVVQPGTRDVRQMAKNRDDNPGHD